MFKFIGFLVALAAAVWVFSDAKARGVSGGKAIVWSLATFFLLIVFLPLWLIMRPKSEVGVTIEGKPSACAHCGKYYEGTPAYCPNCGGQVLR